MGIDGRVARRQYEREIAPRTLLRTYVQKRLHIWASLSKPSWRFSGGASKQPCVK